MGYSQFGVVSLGEETQMRRLAKVACFAAMVWILTPPTQLRADSFDVVFTPAGTINAAFPSPFNIYNYGFTPVGNFGSISGNGVTISSISVSADGHINGTNPGPPTNVAFDWEIYVGSTAFGLPTGQILGSPTAPDTLHNTTAPTRLRFAEGGPASANTTPTFSGSYDFLSNTLTVGPSGFGQFLKEGFTSPMNLIQGLDVQLFLWTESPLTNIDFSNVKVEIKGQGVAPVPEPNTLTLLSTGTMGLLAYMWRRRKVPLGS
jgi:hypothetical protein